MDHFGQYPSAPYPYPPYPPQGWVWSNPQQQQHAFGQPIPLTHTHPSSSPQLQAGPSNAPISSPPSRTDATEQAVAQAGAASAEDGSSPDGSRKRRREYTAFQKAIWEQTQKYSDEGVASLRKDWEDNLANKPMPPPPPGVFETKDECLESVRDFAKSHGYKLNIEHTFKTGDETTRLMLGCHHGGKHVRASTEPVQRNKPSRKTDCPMRIRLQKRKWSTEWVVVILDSQHNHAPDIRYMSIPPGEYPDIEAALFDWHTAEIARGETVHGNTLKSRFLALFAESPQCRGKEPPNLDRDWLDRYRLRHGLQGPRPVRPGGPPQLVDWNDAEAVAAATAEMRANIPRTRETVAFTGVDTTFDDEDALLRQVKQAVKDYMSRYDASHDWDHILRVLSLSKRILRKESPPSGSLEVDPKAVYLAALCHDLGDHKYAKPGENVDNQIAELLLEHGARTELAMKVQLIARNVSFSNETKNPRMMKAVLDQYPELGIVQDADRLDAIGAIGIGRTFVFTGAKKADRSMAETIDHFGEKLERLEGMMKTNAGKQMARERTERLTTFRSWWNEEYELME